MSKINLNATWCDGNVVTKEDYIKLIDGILKSWIYDDERSLEEYHAQFYNELHPELDIDEEEL